MHDFHVRALILLIEISSLSRQDARIKPNVEIIIWNTNMSEAGFTIRCKGSRCVDARIESNPILAYAMRQKGQIAHASDATRALASYCESGFR